MHMLSKRLASPLEYKEDTITQDCVDFNLLPLKPQALTAAARMCSVGY
jgi:hypothetical protein